MYGTTVMNSDRSRWTLQPDDIVKIDAAIVLFIKGPNPLVLIVVVLSLFLGKTSVVDFNLLTVVDHLSDCNLDEAFKQ